MSCQLQEADLKEEQLPHTAHLSTNSQRHVMKKYIQTWRVFFPQTVTIKIFAHAVQVFWIDEWCSSSSQSHTCSG